MATGYSRSVMVKFGEASESDNDDEIVVDSATGTNVDSSLHRRPVKALVVPGEASESDEEEIMTDGSSPHLSSKPSHTHGRRDARDPQSPQQQSNYHTSLLHKKLKERNALLRKRIVHMAQQPYVDAGKDMSAICQQLVKSQALIQDVGPILRQLTNNLFYLEDKLDITLDCAKLVPAIQMEATTATATTPTITSPVMTTWSSSSS